MTEADVARLTSQLLWAGFALSALFGWLAQRSHFCTMGAVADAVNFGDWSRARMWALAVAVALLGFNAMAALGWLKAADTIYAGPRLLWLSALVGGAMFGFGMVLASGCGSKNLVRLGGGNLKALVVLIVMGVAAFATLKGITAVLRVRLLEPVAVDLGRGQDLPTLLAVSPLLIAAPVALALLAWVLLRPEGRTGTVWLGGVGIGSVVVAVWWLSGRFGFVPEDPRTLEAVFVATSSRRMESLSLVAPLGYALDWLLYFSDTSKVLSLGIVSVAGIVAGSAVGAVADRSFRWEGFGGVEDLANHLVGALLMGVGGVVALGCSIGQGVSGVATLSLGSWLALSAIVLGALGALRYQSWRIDAMV